ncbi:hypothetical protein [Heliorestis convoluta]|uniref:Spore coat protein n=1 Tax=Heliorestis convoluta TaxID=356322 RepID=A0A5Q2N1G8_9FIRM|nr:hypothetical protein [Heliorestis convoluta]QGG49214.1 hypothetical protein FTV88_3139 [Heliorestis convoluta]
MQPPSSTYQNQGGLSTIGQPAAMSWYPAYNPFFWQQSGSTASTGPGTEEQGSSAMGDQQSQSQSQSSSNYFMPSSPQFFSAGFLPPQSLTDKDLLFLTEMLFFQLNAAKKCYHFSQQCSDQQIRDLLDKAGQMHQRHYKLLLQQFQFGNMPSNMMP